MLLPGPWDSKIHFLEHPISASSGCVIAGCWALPLGFRAEGVAGDAALVDAGLEVEEESLIEAIYIEVGSFHSPPTRLP